jgi:hypothetical protein
VASALLRPPPDRGFRLPQRKKNHEFDCGYVLTVDKAQGQQ